MRTVTFETQVHDEKNASKPENMARGILRMYKHPALISREKFAWKMAVKEKHAHR